VLGDSQEAEDCIHDALLRVWRTPNSFRPERGTLRAFLIGCVRNEALSRLRSDARRVAREKKGYLQEMPLDAVPSDDPLEAARVRAALSSLPAEQRVTIQQAFFEDLSQRQIAEKLGLPLGTVKSRMLLGMRKLRAQLREVAP
jgi:RNA polymerase sigma-70 factor (ECF subfamily)